MGRILEPIIDEREHCRVFVRMLLRGVLEALNGDRNCRDIQLLNLWRLLYKNRVDVWHEPEQCIKDGIEKAAQNLFPQTMTREQVANELLSVASELYSTEGKVSLIDKGKLARFIEFLSALLGCLDNKVVAVTT